MNDFHTLSICLERKDTNAAMLVFRDKSEFAARKILEKLKIKPTPETGKLFWQWLQSWILTRCR